MLAVARGHVGNLCLSVNGTRCVDPNTECHEGVCVCAQGAFEKDGACVSKVELGGVCTMRDMCMSDSAYCRNGKCACFTGYRDTNGTCVPKIRLFGACSAGEVCLDQNAVCRNGSCRMTSSQKCGSSNFHTSTMTSPYQDVILVGTDEAILTRVAKIYTVPRGTLGRPCLFGDACADNSLQCTGGICHCRTGLKQVNGKCEPSDPGVTGVALFGSCSFVRVCQDPSAICWNGTCLCQTSYYDNNGTCRAKGGWNAPCLFGQFCTDGNQHCQSGRCRCRAAFIRQGNVCVRRSGLKQACTDALACNYDNAACLGGVCGCRQGYVEYRGVCGCLFSYVPGLECEKAERGHLHILDVRVKSDFGFHLMQVRCWLIMFIFAQSMAGVNRNDAMTHPCRTPDFTVNLVIEYPTLQEKFL
ncbi:hypothetical protein LSAT2_028963 [Lamellibrachia satsuma]|nr:hypothetical protein LSAT2_028963 [Lamellibrachia satsuma]